MIVLGLDTATSATTVALWDTATGTVRERRDDPPVGARPRHTALLLELAREALVQEGLEWAQLDRIAVGVGPGTFTGIRIGVATARALASAREIPIVGVSSLRALASHGAGAAPEGAQTIAVLDARRGEVFAAAWTQSEVRDVTAPPTIAPRAVGPQELAATLEATGGSWWAVGDGAIAFRDVLEATGIGIPEDDSPVHRLTAVETCRLGLAGEPATPDEIEPEYLRLPDAELNRRARESQSAS